MGCSCRLSHCPECMGGRNPEPLEKGSRRWKDRAAVSYCIQHQLNDRSRVVKLPKVDGYELGYMEIIHYPGSGTDYRRVDKIEQISEAKEKEDG